MTGCSATDCVNRSENGFMMKNFPRDPIRRAQWVAAVNRQGWIPTDASHLCEIHFPQDMWEKTRVDGKRKLKRTAIPTVFGSEAKQIKSYRETMTHAEISTEPVCIQNVKIEEHETSNLSLRNEEDNGNNEMQVEHAKSKITELEKKLKRMKQFASKQARIIKNRNTRLIKLQKSMHANSVWKRKEINATLLSNLQQMFTKDQISFLMSNKKKVKQWSNQSILKALKLRLSCGMDGYEELRRQHVPLPGIRTLHKRLQNFNFESDISEDISTTSLHMRPISAANYEEDDSKYFRFNC